MTPKEKSKELINLFYYSLPNNGSETGLNSTTERYKEGIQCGIICCDEILKALESDNIIYGSEYRFGETDYWQEVKNNTKQTRQ